MPRRTRRQTPDIEALQREIAARFLDSPLHEVGARLSSFLRGLVQAVEDGSATYEQLNDAAAFTRSHLSLLPQTYGERFAFDSALIQAIARLWKDAGVRVPSVIVPTYSGDWGYQCIPMPSEDRQVAHAIRLIHFPHSDSLDEIDLLEYPWVVHEIGHDLLFRNPEVFDKRFAAALKRRLDRMQVRSLSDRGRASNLGRSRLERIAQLWTPTADHRNWAHELAVDIVGLWVCGPAYLECFCDVAKHPAIDPDQVAPGHPPYTVRARGLIDGGVALSWSAHLSRLRELLNKAVDSTRENFAVAAADHEIVASCVSSALQACSELGVPKCEQVTVERVRAVVERGLEVELGTDLFVAAWLIHSTQGEDAASEWERKTIRRIYDAIDITR